MPLSEFFEFDLYQKQSTVNESEVIQGNLNSGILVIAKPSSEEDLLFLDNILKAVKLTPRLEHSAHLDLLINDYFPLASWSRRQDVHTVLVFGVPLAQLGIRAQCPQYHFLRLGQLHILHAHSLQQLREERAQQNNKHAGELWQALKTKFL